MMPTVLCYGSLGLDLVHQAPRLPAPGEDLASERAELCYGGGAANPAVALAAWGARPRVAGHALGDDPLAAWLLRDLARRGVETRFVVTRPEASTPHCVVVVTPDGERTILSSGYQGTEWPPPPPEAWEGLEALVVDGYSGAAGREAARLGREAGLVVVGIDVPQAAPLCHWVVRSRGEHPDSSQAAGLAAAGVKVLLTDGPRTAQLFSPEGTLSVDPPAVRAVDPTGAGDVTAAMGVLGALLGWPEERTARWAVTAGALLASRGRRAGIPTLGEVEQGAADPV